MHAGKAPLALETRAKAPIPRDWLAEEDAFLGVAVTLRRLIAPGIVKYAITVETMLVTENSWKVEGGWWVVLDFEISI